MLMKIAVIISILLWCQSSMAAGQSSEPLNAQQQEIYKNLIETSACAYTTPPGMLRKRMEPLLFRTPSPCSDKSKYQYQCLGTIFCANTILTPFYIEEAICWSDSSTRCPSAKECALRTIFDAARVDKNYSLPVLKQESGTTRWFSKLS